MRALAVAGGAAACLVLPAAASAPAGAAGAPERPAPQVRLHTLRVPGHDRVAVARAGGRSTARAVVLDAGTSFTLAGVVCDVPEAGAVTVALRASSDGATWTRWFRAPLEIVDEPGKPAKAYIEPIWTGRARYMQVAARGARGAAAALTGVRVVAMDPGAPTEASALSAAPADWAAPTPTTSSTTARGTSAAPVIVTRAQWGADESLRGDAPSYSPVKVAIVHHTASNNTYTETDAPGIVRAIYAYHTTSLHWNDIGYNFLIDRFGTIYEGRYGGISRGVIGAQAGGFNTGSTGISVMGTFSDGAPPAAAVAAIEKLLAWKLTVSGVDPLGTAQLTCGLADKYKLGQVVTFDAISGHRDANLTECPGDKLYALLPAIRADVAARIGSGGGGGGAVVPTLTADTALVSPNGDGVLDKVEFTVALSAAADWRLAVKDADGATIASWSGQGEAGTASWDGTSGSAKVPDGDYTAELSSSSAASTSTVSVAVDTAAPKLEQADAAPDTFSPNGDGQTEATVATYVPAEECAVRVGIQDAGGNVVRWLHGWRTEKTVSQTASWDGRVRSGGSLVAAPDGQYRFDIERRDAAGNIARKGLKVLVDRTLGFPSVSPAVFSPDGNGTRDVTKVAFKLTRRAAVRVSFAVAGNVVRTISVGTLAAGSRSLVWDGRDTAGTFLASSKVDVTVTAVSSVGTSTVMAKVGVDLFRPRIYAAGSKSATARVSTRLAYKVTDPFSTKADVSFVVTDAKGRQVASGHPGSVTTGADHVATWKPAVRGKFTVTWHATDLAGNKEAARARTIVTVR